MLMQQSPVNSQAIQQLKTIMHQIQAAQNPQLMLNQMMMSNPQLRDIINLIKSNGGNMQTTFYNLAKQMNVDPQAVLNALQN